MDIYASLDSSQSKLGSALKKCKIIILSRIITQILFRVPHSTFTVQITSSILNKFAAFKGARVYIYINA